MSAKDSDKKTITIKRSFLVVLLLTAVSFGAFIGRGTKILGGIYENSSEEISADSGVEFRFIRPLRGPRPADRARAPRELRPFRYKVDAHSEQAERRRCIDSIRVIPRPEERAWVRHT